MEFTINLATPDNGERFVIEMSNATLTSIEGFQASDADLTVTVNRADLEPVMMGVATLASAVEAGKARLEGDPSAWGRLASTFVEFDPAFELMPGTAR